MVRFILAVIFGYLCMALLVMAGFAVGFLKPELAFHAGTPSIRPGWLAYTLVLSLGAALAGGWVCRRLARARGPVIALAGLALAIGIGSAVHNAGRPAPTVSAEELAAMAPAEQLQHARQPDWYAFTLPALAASGILLGARSAGSPRASHSFTPPA